MATVVSEFQITHLVDADESRVERAMAAVRRWDEINQGHQTEKRTQQRFAFVGRPFVQFRYQAKDRAVQQIISFQAWGHDLSCGGIRFLASREIVPVLASDTSCIVPLEEVLQNQPRVAIGLPKANAPIVWVDARISRCRRTQEGLLDCGAQFFGKI